MAIEKINKLYLLGHRETEEEIVNLLHELGVVEISEFLPGQGEPPGPDLEESKEKIERKLEHLEHILESVKSASPRKGHLAGREKIMLSRKQLQEIIEGEQIEELYKKCVAAERQLGEIRLRMARLNNEKQQMVPWLPLDIKLDRLDSTREVGIAAGHLPQRRYDDLAEAVASMTEEFFIRRAGTDGKVVCLVLLYSRDLEASIEELLKEHEFSAQAFPEGGMSPAEIIGRVEKELESAENEMRLARGALEEMIPMMPRLLVLHDHYSNRLARENARLKLSRTAESICLTGWIPASEIPRVKKGIEKRCLEAEIFFAEPDETETVPVMLDNPGIVEPFEVVTDLYGRPVYKGVDPTPYLAVFYALFFGFCLSDAGYGIILMLITGLLLQKTSKEGESASRKFFRLFFLGGAASVVLGAFVGGWFGVTVRWKVIDPLEDLLIFFGLAIALGVIHIFTGLTIKMISNIKKDSWATGIYDQGLWMIFMSALIVMALVKGSLLPEELNLPSKIASLGAALGIVFFQGREADRSVRRMTRAARRVYQSLWIVLTAGLTFYFLDLLAPAAGYVTLASIIGLVGMSIRNMKNLFARIGLGLYSLYGISGFLGDTLSYSRLLALGLTTGIVAMIINKMAGISMAIPYAGWLMALAIVIAGHAFNLVINLLGAFVHSCRLQYVEFFTKFYEAGGRAFRPFQVRNKYILFKS